MQLKKLIWKKRKENSAWAKKCMEVLKGTLPSCPAMVSLGVEVSRNNQSSVLLFQPPTALLSEKSCWLIGSSCDAQLSVHLVSWNSSIQGLPEVVITPAGRGRKWYQSGQSSGIPQSLLQDGGTYSWACLCGCGQGADLGLLRFPLPLPRSHDHPLCQSHHGPLQCHPHVNLGGAAPGWLRHRTGLSIPNMPLYTLANILRALGDWEWLWSPKTGEGSPLPYWLSHDHQRGMPSCRSQGSLEDPGERNAEPWLSRVEMMLGLHWETAGW